MLWTEVGDPGRCNPLSQVKLSERLCAAGQRQEIGNRARGRSRELHRFSRGEPVPPRWPRPPVYTALSPAVGSLEQPRVRTPRPLRAPPSHAVSRSLPEARLVVMTCSSLGGVGCKRRPPRHGVRVAGIGAGGSVHRSALLLRLPVLVSLLKTSVAWISFQDAEARPCKALPKPMPAVRVWWERGTYHPLECRHYTHLPAEDLHHCCILDLVHSVCDVQVVLHNKVDARVCGRDGADEWRQGKEGPLPTRAAGIYLGSSLAWPGVASRDLPR